MPSRVVESADVRCTSSRDGSVGFALEEHAPMVGNRKYALSRALFRRVEVPWRSNEGCPIPKGRFIAPLAGEPLVVLRRAGGVHREVDPRTAP
jgi:hypothetical protein